MKYNGIVIRTSKKQLFLFILDPILNELKDGINISDHAVYDDMKKNQLMVVDVLFKDGTIELDNIDLEEFIHGDSYGRNNVFIHIKDVLLYTISNEEKNTDITMEEIIKSGKLNDVGIECIENTKKEQQDNV